MRRVAVVAATVFAMLWLGSGGGDLHGQVVGATLTGLKTLSGPVGADGSVGYTVILSNQGPGTQGDNPGDEFTDVLPSSLTLVSATAVANVGTAVATVGTNTVTWNGSLADGDSVTILISATVSASVPGGTTISNQGTISFDSKGGGINDATALTDDPGTSAPDDPTSFTISYAANLIGTKTVSGTFSPGGTVAYSVVLSNTGAGTQSDNPGDEFTDLLSTRLLLVSATATSGTAVTNANTNTVTWNGSLESTGSVTITITATVSGSLPGGTTISNQGTIGFDSDGNGTNESYGVTDDPGPSGDYDPTSFMLRFPPGVSALKTVSGFFRPGFRLTYIVVVGNGGPFAKGDNPGDEFTDVLPASLVLLSAEASSGTAVADPGTNTVTWNGVLLKPDVFGDTVTITIDAIVAPTTLGGTLVANQGSLNYDGDGDGTNESTGVTDDPDTPVVADATSFTVSSPATLRGTKTVSGTFMPGEAITYAVIVSNVGQGTQGDNPGDEFTDVLPASLVLLSATATSGTAVAMPGTNTVTWNGTLGTRGKRPLDTTAVVFSDSVTITINAVVAPTTLGGTLVANQGSISYDFDGNGTNEASTVTDNPNTSGPPDPTSFTISSPAILSGIKTVSGTFMPGFGISYTVVLSNAGPGTQGDNPGDEFTDVLPASLTLLSASATSGTVVAATGTNIVTWNGSLASSAVRAVTSTAVSINSVTITIYAVVGSFTPAGTLIGNQGSIAFDADGNGTNEASTVTDDPGTPAAADPTSFTITSPATLSGTKTVTGTFRPDTPVTYTVVVSNSGPSTQGDNPGDEFTDILPAGLTLISATASSGTAIAAIGSNTVTWNGSLVSGARGRQLAVGKPASSSATIEITAMVDPTLVAGTTIANQGQISFDADGDGLNEASTVTDDPKVGGLIDPTSFVVISPATITATKTVVGTFRPGGAVIYTVVLSNAGPAAQGDNPGDEFTDILPASLTLVSAFATSGTATAAIGTNTVTWNGRVTSGAAGPTVMLDNQVTITINATILASNADGTVVMNQGAIGFDADGDGTNEASAVTDDPDVAGATDPTRFAVSADAPVSRATPFIDLDGDGLGDAVLYNVATGAASGQVNDGAGVGTFTATGQLWDAGWKVFPVNLNSDALTDVFFYHPVKGVWVQALNMGAGGFAYTVGNWNAGAQVYPADLDGDGLSDVFLYNAATGVWLKYLADGSGGFAVPTTGNWDPDWTFATADLNGDGRDDFFLYHRTTGIWVEAYSQAGAAGTFDYPAAGQWDLGWELYPADLDGDLRTDLFLINASGLHVTALSQPDGDFSYPAAGVWAQGWTIAPGDLDGDGRTDLFLYNAVSGLYEEARSDGAGDFTYESGQWDPGWTVGMTDADGDGRTDILVSNATGVWVQATTSGPGTFTYMAGNWGAGSTVFTQRPPVR
ncbi:MAG: FG-GAP-like repeat-containing protein [Acidobacteriota bacterium]